MAAMTAAAFLCAYACQVYDESDLEVETPEDPGEVLTGGRAPTGGAPFVAMPNSGSGGVPAAGGAGSRGGGGSGGRSGVTGSMGGGQITGNGGSEAGMGGEAGSPGGTAEPGSGGVENAGGSPEPGGGSPAVAGGGTTGGGETGGASTGGAPVAPELIDDCDDGNNQLRLNQERNGYWSTFGPTTCNNSPTNTMATQFMSAASTGNGTGLKALHFVSQGGDEDSCGVGFDFSKPKAAYDASAYAGVSFGARSASGSQILLVKVAMVGTDPMFDLCDDAAEPGSGEQCYDHFLAPVTVTATWAEYTVSFEELMQEGWGYVPPDGFDPAEVVGIQWVAKPGTSDFWIDDVKFVE
jgi:hypothetical protein